MRGRTAHFCFLPFRYFNSMPHVEAVLHSLSCYSLRIPVVRQFLDVVHQAVKFPLRIHLRFSPEGEAVKLLVVPQVAKHGFYCSEAPAIACTPFRAVDTLPHLVGVAFLICFAVQERHLSGLGLLRSEQTTISMCAR